MRKKGKGSIRRWENLNTALENYRLYLARKQGSELTMIDLLYISNFKGGNASIIEPEVEVTKRLPKYDDRLAAIRSEFGNKSLRDLEARQLSRLIELVEDTLRMASAGIAAIRGFGPSYLSALLHVNFPGLIPIFDRRVLINARVVKRGDVHNNLQIKDIAAHADDLIRYCHTQLQSGKGTLRDLDRQLFIKDLDELGLDIAN